MLPMRRQREFKFNEVRCKTTWQHLSQVNLKLITAISRNSITWHSWLAIIINT